MRLIWLLLAAFFALGAARAALAEEPASDEKKSYAIPAAEIAGFEFLLNRFNRHHYGVAPQALVALRLIFGATASLDFTARVTVRLHRQHAVAIKYLWNRRDATFAGRTDLAQTRGTVGIYYKLLGHDRFGAVDWL